MIVILSGGGNILEADAEIRVNTVNCVGVMGAGLALAFKAKYPAMFLDYQRVCREGKLAPGHLHYWPDYSRAEVVNFPTKVHWRDPSKYEYIEAGLDELKSYLAARGKVRVALPALGCGHGGLDWARVSALIAQHLGDLEAEVIVFAPYSSREAGKRAKIAEDSTTEQELRSRGVLALRPGQDGFPSRLRASTWPVLYVRGNPALLAAFSLAVVPSAQPSQREIKAALSSVEQLAAPELTLVVGYGPKLDRPIIQVARRKGANVVICLPEGILKFVVRRDLQDVWDESHITVVSSSRPLQSWTPSTAKRARELELELADRVLITDPKLHLVTGPAQLREKAGRPAVYYLDNPEIDDRSRRILSKAKAIPVVIDMETACPRLEPLRDELRQRVIPTGIDEARLSSTVCQSPAGSRGKVEDRGQRSVDELPESTGTHLAAGESMGEMPAVVQDREQSCSTASKGRRKSRQTVQTVQPPLL